MCNDNIHVSSNNRSSATIADCFYEEDDVNSSRGNVVGNTNFISHAESGKIAATVADTNYSVNDGSRRHAETVADAGYLVNNIDKRHAATVADGNIGINRATNIYNKFENLEQNAINTALENVDTLEYIRQAKADAFFHREDFDEAVKNISELVSRKNISYKVIGPLTEAGINGIDSAVVGGEATMLKCCAPDGVEVVAKVYYKSLDVDGSSSVAKVAILNFMETEESRLYVLPIEDIGLVNLGSSLYYFEITRYCNGGNLSDLLSRNAQNNVRIPFDTIVMITRMFNEALHCIHNAGLIHRDIKLENVLINDNKWYFTDFGKANLAQNGVNVTTTFVRTSGYAAPEICLGIATTNATFVYTPKVDYYAFGITLASLYEGKYVYEGQLDTQIQESIRRGIPDIKRADQNSEQFKNLLRGLCSFNPNERFGYEEVNKWLANHNYTVKTTGRGWGKEFELRDGTKVNTEELLFKELTKNGKRWNEGLRYLYNNFFEEFFKSFKTRLAIDAEDIVSTYRSKNEDKGLSVFLNSLFPHGGIAWKGKTFMSLSKLAEEMYNTDDLSFYSEILNERIVSYWLDHAAGITIGTNEREIVEKIENLSDEYPKAACMWFVNAFYAKQVFVFGRRIDSLEDLFITLFSEPKRFFVENYLNKLLDVETGYNIYGFIFCCGCFEIFITFWNSICERDRYHATTELFNMFYQMAIKNDEMVGNKKKRAHDYILDFYVNYGPIGVDFFTFKLVNSTPLIYEGLSTEGKTILDKIRNYTPHMSGDIASIYKHNIELESLINQFRALLIDNPYLINSGFYDQNGIICRNLKGCFSFNIYQVTAPLGFKAFILN